MDSGAYLQISKLQAEQYKDCFKFEMSDNPAPSRVIFDILPRYKYRQEGDKVAYKDHILFLNTNKHGYIHYDAELSLPPDEGTHMPSSYRPSCPHRRPQLNAIFEKYEINIGSEAAKWQVFPYRQFYEEKITNRLVFGGSVVRLKHAESGGYICIDDEGKLPTGELQAYLRIYTGSSTGENADEQVSTNSLFEIEIDTNEEHGKPTTWEDLTDQKNAKPMQYRFRHLNSGRVITIKTISKNGKDIHVLTSGHILGKDHVLSVDKRAPSTNPDIQQIDEFNKEMAAAELKNSLFILKSSTIDNDNYINGDCVVKIISSMNNFYLTSVKKKSQDQEEEED